MDIQSLENEALQLPTRQRARLAHRLLESLDDLSESEGEAAWIEEAHRRANELDSSSVQPVSPEELERRIRATLR